MKELNEKRKKFCRHIANGETGAGAYRRAYKNKNGKTCKRNAHRLLEQPQVLIYLTMMNDYKQNAKPTFGDPEPDPAVVKKKRQKYVYSPDEEMELEECKVRLSRIARGEVTSPKYIVCKGEVIEKMVPPSFAQQRSCITELIKIRGGVYRKIIKLW